MNICENCSVSFKPGPGSKGRYCSPTCSKIGQAKEIKIKGKSKRQHNIEQYLDNPSCCKNCNAQLPYDKRHNTFCCNSCSASYTNTGKVKSLETRNKIGKWAKANPRGAILKPHRRHGPIQSKWTTSHCKECGNLIKHLKSKTVTYCSKTCSRKNAFHANSTIVHRCQYNNFQLDSGAELVFAKELDKRNIKWLKNDGKSFKKSFTYIKNNGKPGTYYPDFYLPDLDLWVEIKGRKYANENDKLKLAAVNNIVMLISNEFKQNLPIFFESIQQR